MEMIPQQVGRWLVVIGLGTAAFGLVLMLINRLGPLRIPGDLVFGSRNWRLYLPIGTCLLASAILTLILWIINLFRR